MCKNKHRNGGNMSKIIVAYWSQTGNTEAMANAVGEGIKAAGIFKSLVSIILIVIANQIAKRNGEERLF